MYQFDHVDDAVEAGRTLAAGSACLVLLMQNTDTGRLSIGLRSSVSIRQAGRHAGTVYPSGRVEMTCLNDNWASWLYQALFNSLCACE